MTKVTVRVHSVPLMNGDWVPCGNQLVLWVCRNKGSYHPHLPSPFVIITIIISLLYPSTWLLFPHTPIVAKFCLYPHKTSILTQQSLQNTCCHPHLLCSSHWLTEYRLRTQLSSIGKVHKFSNESVHWQYQFKLSKMLSNRFTVCSSRHTTKLKYRNSNLTRSVSIQVEVLWICFIPTGTFILTGFAWIWSVSLLQSNSLVDSGVKYS